MAARTGKGETPIRTLRVETAEWQRWAEVAASLGIKGLSARGISSAFCSASAREFPTLTSPPSFYALRHAASAEVKAAEGSDPQLVAMAMGHASERSQQAYGMRSQASGGYAIEATATRAVRPARPKAGPPSSPTPAARARGAPRGSPRPRG